MHREPGTKAPCFAVVNQKGGVGKSTTVVNVASWLALDGAKVLIVDLDPQANATTGVGIDHHRVPGNIYQILVDDKPLEDAIEASAIKDLYCVPSTLDLAGAEIELVPAFSRELKLRKALEPVAFDFDYIFIDCPPSLGILTVNALAAASELIVPIQCEYYALEGLSQLMKNTSLVQSNLNPTLDLFGILLTMYDSRTKLAEQVAAEVRSHFPGKVFTASIPRSVRLSEAPSHGLPIALYDARSKGSLAYHSVANEVARGIGSERSLPEGSETPPPAIPTVVSEAEEAPTHARSTNVPETDQRPSSGPIAPNGSVDLTEISTEEAPEHQRSPASSAPNAEGGSF